MACRQRSSICSPVTLHVTCYMLHVTHMLMLTMYTTHVIALLTKSSVYQPSNNWWVWKLNGILCHHIRFFIILEPFTPMLYNLEHINNSYRMAFRRINVEVPSHLNTLYIYLQEDIDPILNLKLLALLCNIAILEVYMTKSLQH